MRSLLTLLFFGLIVWVVYATFFGSSDDKDKRDRLFKGLKETGEAISDILKSQKGLYDAGEYDKALDKISGVIEQLKKGQDGSAEKAAELARLEKQKAELENLIQRYESDKENHDKASQTPPGGQGKTKRAEPGAEEPSTAPMEKKLAEIQKTIETLSQ
jgi:hypothetical protein